MKISDAYQYFFGANDGKPAESAKIRDIKEHHAKQLAEFETWAAAQQWDKIHHAHYDWWMFPVSRSSSAYGDRFSVSPAEVEAFKRDSAFMTHYRRGFAIVVEAWGWDLEKGEPIAVDPNNSKGQVWDGYGVRLAKMSDSALLFKEYDLHLKLKKFFQEHCLAQQDRIPISDLKWLRETLSA